MELILSGLRFETCLIYLDDVIVNGKRSQRKWNIKRFSHGLNLLDLGLNQANVCCFSRASRSWATETDPAKVERVCDWPVPENAYDVEVLRTFQLLSALCS